MERSERSEETSRVYGAAVIVLGIAAAFYGAQSAWVSVLLSSRPAAADATYVFWLGPLAAALGSIVIGILLVILAVKYLTGQLAVPDARSAKVGRAMATAALFLAIACFCVLAMAGSLRTEAAQFIALAIGPVNVLILLGAGVALVEGSRVLESAHTVSRRKVTAVKKVTRPGWVSHSEWVDTHPTDIPDSAVPESFRFTDKLGRCSNCGTMLPMTAPQCLACEVTFGPQSDFWISPLHTDV